MLVSGIKRGLLLVISMIVLGTSLSVGAIEVDEEGSGCSLTPEEKASPFQIDMKYARQAGAPGRYSMFYVRPVDTSKKPNYAVGKWANHRVDGRAFIYGDADGDGIISWWDAYIIGKEASNLTHYKLGDTSMVRMDINRDGCISGSDFNYVMGYLRHGGVGPTTSRVGTEGVRQYVDHLNKKGVVDSTIGYFTEGRRYIATVKYARPADNGRRLLGCSADRFIDFLDECPEGANFRLWYVNQYSKFV